MHENTPYFNFFSSFETFRGGGCPLPPPMAPPLLCINHKKSDAIWIGSLKNNDYKIGNVNWKLFPGNIIKILGITFSPNIPLEEMNCNWDEKMKKIEKL